jgi:sortase B
MVTLTISLKEIISWNIDKKNTNKQIKEIEKIVTIEERKDTEATEIITQVEEPPKANNYWDFIKMDLMYVDFSELMLINSNTKGWITVNGTNINYPFVQTNDNVFYLDHSFDNSYNEAGWVFLDYRNKMQDINKNTIIYAHGRLDTTMFGSLKNIIKNNWYNDSNNHIIKLSTAYENTLWQVFSVYKIKTTSDYLQIDFHSDNEYQKFLNKLLNRSAFNFNTTINATDKILTLSTCYNDDEKVVMHAKLIKKEQR